MPLTLGVESEKLCVSVLRTEAPCGFSISSKSTSYCVQLHMAAGAGRQLDGRDSEAHNCDQTKGEQTSGPEHLR